MGKIKCEACLSVRAEITTLTVNNGSNEWQATYFIVKKEG